jgi:hypothetical protein
LGSDAQRDFTPLDPDEYNAFLTDPLKFGAEALEGKDFTRLFGGAGNFILGPVGGLIGGAIGAGMTAQNVAQARAASQIAKAKGLDTTALDAQIASYISGLPNLSRMSSDLLTSGDRIAERFFQTARDMGLPESEYGKNPLTRDFFAPGAAGDQAFAEEMQKTAPPGMVYQPETESYVRPESESAAPTTSPRPAPRPTTPAPAPAPAPRPTTPAPAPVSSGRDDSDSGTSFAPTSSPRPEPRPDRDSGSGGGGGKDGTVICTALYNLGLLEHEIYKLDAEYGNLLEAQRPEVLAGYRKLATPLAGYIQKNTFGARLVRSAVAPIARAWANEMAHIMQPDTYKGNLLGKIIIKIGYPVCTFVGKNTKETTYAT